MGNLNVADAPDKEAPELSHNYLESPLLALLVLPSCSHPGKAYHFRFRALALQSLGLKSQHCTYMLL